MNPLKSFRSHYRQRMLNEIADEVGDQAYRQGRRMGVGLGGLAGLAIGGTGAGALGVGAGALAYQAGKQKGERSGSYKNQKLHYLMQQRARQMGHTRHVTNPDTHPSWQKKAFVVQGALGGTTGLIAAPKDKKMEGAAGGALGGIAGSMVGGPTGAILGGGAGLAASIPTLGLAAPLFVPAGAIAGGLAGNLAGSIGGGYLGSRALAPPKKKKSSKSSRKITIQVKKAFDQKMMAALVAGGQDIDKVAAAFEAELEKIAFVMPLIQRAGAAYSKALPAGITGAPGRVFGEIMRVPGAARQAWQAGRAQGRVQAAQAARPKIDMPAAPPVAAQAAVPGATPGPKVQGSAPAAGSPAATPGVQPPATPAAAGGSFLDDASALAQRGYQSGVNYLNQNLNMGIGTGQGVLKGQGVGQWFGGLSRPAQAAVLAPVGVAGLGALGAAGAGVGAAGLGTGFVAGRMTAN